MPRLLILILVLLTGLETQARALESTPAVSTRATVSLVSDTDTVSPGTPFRIGLRIRLAPGWHTYWRNPGDAGVAPELDLALPNGATAGPIGWPAPQRLAEGPLMTYAYTGEVLLPLTITPALAAVGLGTPAGGTPAPGAPTLEDRAVTIAADARWLVCKQICVPEQAHFTLNLPAGNLPAGSLPAGNLPAGNAAPSAQASLFAATDRRIPRASPWPAHIAADGTLWLRGAELNTANVTSAWFIPSVAGTLEDTAAQPLSIGSGGLAGGLTLALKPGPAFKPGVDLDGVLAVLDRSGQETDVAVHATPGAPPPELAMSLARVLGFAFLGGLILNLMPCVFPVLAMKALGLAAGAAQGRMRGHALSYTAGVLLAFAALGGALLAARAAGAAAGWGFQFASPVFVAAMAWLLFGVGLNLSGAFEIGTGLAGAGQRLVARGGHSGSFFTGLLAVLVATPCTAPFMGVAIAAALAAPPAETIVVFLAMGLGLAAPYALFAAVPALGRLAPPPGRWMDRLRQGLAFPMYGACAWLVWVVSQEAGPAGVLGCVAGLVLLGFAAWVGGVAQQETGRTRRFAQSVAVAALLVALAVLSGIGEAPSAPLPTEAGTEAYSATRLAALRAEGRPVFVNMTAAWCVTCLVNERVAIASTPVRDAFAAHHVAYLKGDWTRQDGAITAFLREHGRDGVPLYVYFPPGEGAPEVLPQILTEQTVLRAIGAG
jgi:thiol:disulfide interchange protein/DsbC/DsbD-like thiol-disulfide interchange protein